MFTEQYLTKTQFNPNKMATSKTLLKTFFETGKRPTEAEFEQLIDSFLHLDESPIIKTDASPLTINHYWAGTQAEYDALPSYDLQTIYYTKP